MTGRSTPTGFSDKMETGWKKLVTTSWLKDTLAAKLEETETGEEETHIDTDIEYELPDTL